MKFVLKSTTVVDSIMPFYDYVEEDCIEIRFATDLWQEIDDIISICKFGATYDDLYDIIKKVYINHFDSFNEDPSFRFYLFLDDLKVYNFENGRFKIPKKDKEMWSKAKLNVDAILDEMEDDTSGQLLVAYVTVTKKNSPIAIINYNNI